MTLTIPPLQKLLCFHFAKIIWNISFSPEFLQSSEIENDEEEEWEIRLTICRENAICNLDVFTEDMKNPTLVKTLLKDSIYLLHQSYNQLALWTINYDLDFKIDLLEEGELYAPNYFTVDGEFDDVAWTKRFVLSSDYPMARRFSLASCYWFENEMANLWAELENLNELTFEDGFDYLGLFKNDFRRFKISAYYLNSQLVINESSGAQVFTDLFRVSVVKGFEHAVYSLWQKMSETDKINTMEKDYYFQYIAGSPYYPRSKISQFLYSQLSEELKEKFLEWTIDNRKSTVWLTLLFPPFIQEVHSEIFELFYKLPINMIADIFVTLSQRISRLKLPLDGEIFEEFWSKLSSNEKHEALESNRFIIINMVEDKSFYYLGLILKSLSLEQKENFLLKGFYGEAAINSLDILCSEKEFDLLQKYLSFFLFDMDLLTKKQIMQKDAISLLQNFIKSPKFERWCNRLSAFKRLVVKDRADDLHTSATLLYELCEKISEEICTSPTISVYDMHSLEMEVTEISLSILS